MLKDKKPSSIWNNGNIHVHHRQLSDFGSDTAAAADAA
jgi:hypothetical protein